jgi:hypothetical protein
MPRCKAVPRERSVLSGQLSGLLPTPDNWQLKTDNCDEGWAERNRWAFFNSLLKEIAP